MFILLFGLLGFFIGIVLVVIYFSGCNYDLFFFMGLYMCDFVFIIFLFLYINFSNFELQCLVIYDVIGDFLVIQFVSGFSVFNYFVVNVDYINYLEIVCKMGGFL